LKKLSPGLKKLGFSAAKNFPLNTFFQQDCPLPRFPVEANISLRTRASPAKRSIPASPSERIFPVWCRDRQTGTVLAKTGTVIFRSPRYCLRLAGTGMYRARKKQHLAQYGGMIAGRIGL
jgi:hypothetical protein